MYADGRKKDEMNGKINQNNIISFFILAQDQNEGNQANLMFNQQVEIYVIILYDFVLYSSCCYSHFIYQPSQLVLMPSAVVLNILSQDDGVVLPLHNRRISSFIRHLGYD